MPGINCTASCGTHNRFDDSKSSTFSPLPGLEYDAKFGTGGTPVPLSPPQGAHIKQVTDKICLAGLCVPQQKFFAADTYGEAINNQPMDGIFGLSIVNGNSYWWETIVNSGQVPSPEFSFFMLPGIKYGSELTLGGRDPTKFKGPVTDIDLNRNISLGYHAWIMDLPAVYIDGKRVTNKTAPGTPPLPYGLANMDSATASIVAPDYETARDLYAQISPEIYQIDPVGAWGAKCDVVNRVAKAVTFTFGETGKQQINLTMPASAFNAGPYPGQERNNICQSIILNTIPPAR
jgi:cathepsin D